MRNGFLVGAANPKSIAFFVIALPDFTSRGRRHLPVQAQMLAAGALFPLIALLLDRIWLPRRARSGSGSPGHRDGWR
jgi:threonine/homoserine/homoserine lactone efflux protein